MKFSRPMLIILIAAALTAGGFLNYMHKRGDPYVGEVVLQAGAVKRMAPLTPTPSRNSAAVRGEPGREFP